MKGTYLSSVLQKFGPPCRVSNDTALYAKKLFLIWSPQIGSPPIFGRVKRISSWPTAGLLESVRSIPNPILCTIPQLQIPPASTTSKMAKEATEKSGIIVGLNKGHVSSPLVHPTQASRRDFHRDEKIARMRSKIKKRSESFFPLLLCPSHHLSFSVSTTAPV